MKYSFIVVYKLSEYPKLQMISIPTTYRHLHFINLQFLTEIYITQKKRIRWATFDSDNAYLHELFDLSEVRVSNRTRSINQEDHVWALGFAATWCTDLKEFLIKSSRKI